MYYSDLNGNRNLINGIRMLLSIEVKENTHILFFFCSQGVTFTIFHCVFDDQVFDYKAQGGLFYCSICMFYLFYC